MYYQFLPPYFPPPFYPDTRFIGASPAPVGPGYPPTGWPHPSCPQWPNSPNPPTVNSGRPQPLNANASPASRLVPGDFANVAGATPTAASPAPNARQNLQTTYASLLRILRQAEQDSLSSDPAIAKAAKRKANIIGLFFGGVLEGAGLIPAGTFEGALTGDKNASTASETILDVLDSSLNPTRMDKVAFGFHAVGFLMSFTAAVALLLEPF